MLGVGGDGFSTTGGGGRGGEGGVGVLGCWVGGEIGFNVVVELDEFGEKERRVSQVCSSLKI